MGLICAFGGARLGKFTRGGDGSPHTSPKIQFVGKIEWQDEIARRTGGPGWQIGTIRRIANRSNRRSCRNRGELRSAVESYGCARLPKTGFQSFEILVAARYLFFERVELGVSEDLPPGSAQNLIARVRCLPAICLLVHRSERDIGDLVLGSNRTTGEQARQNRGDSDSTECHLPEPPGGVAEWLPLRTAAPLTSESAGSSTTASLAWRPEITSTVLP